MTLLELDRALRTLRLSGKADALDARRRHAQAERPPPLDLVALLVNDALQRRHDRLLERRRAHARFRDPNRSLDSFDFTFTKTMNRALRFALATGRFITPHNDVLFVGPPGAGKSHLAQALGQAAITQGHRVVNREAHRLLEELTEVAGVEASTEATALVAVTYHISAFDDNVKQDRLDWFHCDAERHSNWRYGSIGHSERVDRSGRDAGRVPGALSHQTMPYVRGQSAVS